MQALASLPLARWGIRVAVAISEREATRETLDTLPADVVEVVDVPDYTDEELAELLSRNGRRWRDIRHEMLELMRRPLLAELYVHASNVRWMPTNEYAFYDACWNRLPDEEDGEALRTLASLVVSGEKAYPWPAEVVRSAHISDAHVGRLEALGWLRRDANTVSIWHDRLLNWAVAESLVARHAGDLPALASSIADCARTSENAGLRLGYVPMDVFWLALQRKKLGSEGIAELMRAVEREDVFRTDVFYDELLSTIGSSLAEALLARARHAEPNEAWEIELHVSRALNRIFSDDESSSADFIQGALDDDSALVRAIGVRLAGDFPHGRFSDRLWQIYRELKGTPELPGEESNSGIAMQNSQLVFARERTFSALVRAARLDHAWIRRLVHETPDAAFEDAMWLLSNMDSEAGRLLWLELKSIVLERMPIGSERALLRCIQTAHDDLEVPRVLEIVRKSERFTAATAFAALSVLAPDVALQEYPSIDAANLSFTRSWWLPWLMLRRPEETARAALSRIANDEGAVPYLAQSYYGLEDYLDREIAAAFLAWLVAEIAAFRAEGDEKKHLRLADILRLFMTSSAEALDACAAAEGELGAHLKWLCETLSVSKEGHLKLASREAPVLLRAVSKNEFERFVADRIKTHSRLSTGSGEWA
ncbi:MAG TPA: hypothetical protein VN181_01150, partial [Thermoanaerobaculia bacterium]|nr:hypothetical protein [Thermoanaerobaculia bacterium]